MQVFFLGGFKSSIYVLAWWVVSKLSPSDHIDGFDGHDQELSLAIGFATPEFDAR